MNSASAEQIAPVVIVGAGPGGLAAACTLAAAGTPVSVIDESAQSGGRVWAGSMQAASAQVRHYLSKRGALDHPLIRYLPASRVLAADAQRLLVEIPAGTQHISYKNLILATGARELQMPFEGWTLPGVLGAGGLQLMAKAGMDLTGKRVVVAGTGPLLLAAAVTARHAGAHIVRISELAPRARIAQFAGALMRYPDRLWQALKLQAALGWTHLRAGEQLIAARGNAWVDHVLLQDRHGVQHRVTCDFLAVSFGLVPNIELAALLGCQLRTGADQFLAVAVNEHAQTSIPNIYAVGESSGIGGKMKALAQGEAAALHLLGHAPSNALQKRLRAELGYEALLAQCFAIRPKELPALSPQTLICRCEDVPWQTVCESPNWREAKLQSRCGMGHCQGRYCSAALRVLKGTLSTDWREPIFPCRLESLAQLPTAMESTTPM
jgi:D-hydroxyproline dehydrogenase subunit alpha